MTLGYRKFATANGLVPVRYGSGTPVALPCQIRVTAKSGTNGKVLRVRCICMAQTETIPKPDFTGYDILAEVGTIAEALRVHSEHVDTKEVH